jgi:hypothetical protein
MEVPDAKQHLVIWILVLAIFAVVIAAGFYSLAL